MDTAIKIYEIVSAISTIIFVVTVGYITFLWIKGVTPALLRLGNGLAKRKISIFAGYNNLESLKSLLVDSKLFNQKNIIGITKEEDFGKSEQSTLYLVYWPDWEEKALEILRLKKDKEVFILYAPKDSGLVPDNMLGQMDKKRNVIITNFRGRLLNDVVSSIITSSYQK